MSKELNRAQLLRKRKGLSQKKFADYFGIPVRTIQQWEINQRVPSDYILDMIERIMDLEDELKGVE